MKKLILLVVVVIAVIVGVLWYINKNVSTSMNTSPTPTASPTATPVPMQSVSDGTIKFTYGGDYGLATNPQQVLVTAYIPPCNPAFNYCLYYNGTAYADTNFESAGLRIQKRTDITSKAICMTLMPSGYTGLVPNTLNGPDYETSTFGPLGDAGAGHYANGAEYRLWYANSCYEFETRIGQTQFANYPAGTKQEFTAANQADVQASLNSMLNSITLNNNEQVSFPAPATSPAY